MRKLRRIAIVVLALGLPVGAAWHNRERLPLLREYFGPCRTYLAAGLDADGRADALLLVSVTNAGTKVLVIPRDTRCEGDRKLNSLWSRLGPRRFMDVCAGIVAHPIDGYIGFPFAKLEPFLHTAFPAGLRVKNAYRLHYADRAGGFSYDIPAGDRVLAPSQLSWFLRDRYSDPRRRGEAARVERWRIFLSAARQELASPAGIMRLPSISAAACRVFPTSLSAEDVTALAVTQLRSPGFSVAYLPGRPVKIHGQWFVELDREAARRQARLARSGILVPGNCEVQVLNGTAVPGLARRAAAQLQSGFGTECQAGNALTAWEPATVVEYAPGELEPLARSMGEQLGSGIRIRPSDRWATTPAKQPGHPTIIVTLGHDQVRRGKEVPR